LKSIIGAILLWTSCSYALADTIAIIGTGNVAYALGTEFAAQGHTIVYGSRTPEGESAQELVAKTGAGAGATTPASAVLDAGIVVLAVPGLLVEEITLGLGDLAGKIIIDPTNPLERVGSIMTHAVATSNAEIIQAAAPGAYVVKAFNTLTVQTMMDPSETGGPVSVPLVGDNDAAKSTVAALVQGMGLEPIDVGGLKMAHWVEGMLVIWINNRFTSRPSFDFHLRPIPKSR
jgi:predicted dinucleotide-binding enzyme